MDIKSIKNLKVGEDGLFDLFEPSFQYRNDIPLGSYTVTKFEEMRPDLLFKMIYNIDYSDLQFSIGDLDVLLYINHINNFLEIKEGMEILFPISVDAFELYRFTPDDYESSQDVLSQVAVPISYGKETKLDKTRVDYNNNNFALSPVLQTTREAVKLSNGKFTIGGLK